MDKTNYWRNAVMKLLPAGDPTKWDIGNVRDLIQNAIQLSLTIAGALAVIYLIIGAFGYFTAFGNEEKANKAKTTILWAIIGVVIIILGKVIVAEVWNLVSTEPPDF